MAAVSTVIAAGALAYGIYNNEQQRQDAEWQAKKQRNANTIALREQKNRETILKAEDDRDAAIIRQRAQKTGQSGRAGTILSTAGAASSIPTGTLLGM